MATLTSIETPFGPSYRGGESRPHRLTVIDGPDAGETLGLEERRYRDCGAGRPDREDLG